jgi:hypothetical protein
VAAIAGTAGWAAARIFATSATGAAEREYLLVKARAGTLSDERPLKVDARWQQSITLPNQARGIVTSMDVNQSREVSAGSVLYTVDLHPVVAAEGSVPSFRALGPDTEGDDVKQLQVMLAANGYFTGTPDGRFGSRTTEAVKDWQRESGLEQSGIVGVGDIIYFPALPSRVSFDTEKIAVGLSVSGGEAGVQVLSPAPIFQASATPQQARLLGEGTPVIVGAQKWPGRVAEQNATEDGNVILLLSAENGGSVCGLDCSAVSPAGTTNFDAVALIVPATEGILIPTSAIRTKADGATVVLDKKGTTVPIRLLASAKGQSLVDGLRAGAIIRIDKRQ